MMVMDADRFIERAVPGYGHATDESRLDERFEHAIRGSRIERPLPFGGECLDRKRRGGASKEAKEIGPLARGAQLRLSEVSFDC